IHGMHLDHLLCQIQCNTINLHDGLLLLWDWLINTSSLALRCRISGRSPFHWVQTRALAARVLAAVIGKGRSLKAELGAALPKLDDSRDRALLEAICFAALRRRTVYDQALRQWLQKPLGPRDADLRALLMAGFAQLYVLQLPAHAALSATVDAARVLGRERQAGMVNALLRRAQREGFVEARAEDAWPQWLLAKVRQDWPQQADAIVSESLQPAPLWL